MTLVMTLVHSSLQNMIDCQLSPNEVTDPAVLRAMSEVRREGFVPEAFRTVAYADDNLPLTLNRLMMKPLMFARLLQLAKIKSTDHVLHIAAATGYGSAVLAKMAKRVMAIESNHELAEMARYHLREAQVAVEIFASALNVGYPLGAPYDVIFIEGAVQAIPPGLMDQLKEGGRLVAVKNVMQRLDAPCGLGRAMLARKIDGKLQYDIGSFDIAAALLPGFEVRDEFVL